MIGDYKLVSKQRVLGHEGAPGADQVEDRSGRSGERGRPGDGEQPTPGNLDAYESKVQHARQDRESAIFSRRRVM